MNDKLPPNAFPGALVTVNVDPEILPVNVVDGWVTMVPVNTELLALVLVKVVTALVTVFVILFPENNKLPAWTPAVPVVVKFISVFELNALIVFPVILNSLVWKLVANNFVLSIVAVNVLFA